MSANKLEQDCQTKTKCKSGSKDLPAEINDATIWIILQPQADSMNYLRLKSTFDIDKLSSDPIGQLISHLWWPVFH